MIETARALPVAPEYVPCGATRGLMIGQGRHWTRLRGGMTLNWAGGSPRATHLDGCRAFSCSMTSWSGLRPFNANLGGPDWCQSRVTE